MEVARKQRANLATAASRCQDCQLAAEAAREDARVELARIVEGAARLAEWAARIDGVGLAPSRVF